MKSKRGQFYLLAGVIIISVVMGFVFFSNSYERKSNVNFDYLGKELETESENVVDYGIKNNQNIKTLLINFTQEYSLYTEADNSYFIFGNFTEVTFAGYKKLNSGSVLIDVGSGNQQIDLIQGVYRSVSFQNPQQDIKVTIDNIVYDFRLKNGQNFYFVLSKEIGEERYIVSNNGV